MDISNMSSKFQHITGKDRDEIRKTFDIIVKALEDAGYRGGGGSKTMRFFNKPSIKMFIRDIKGIHEYPYIMIRHYD